MPLIKTAGNKLIAGNGIFAVRQKGPSVPTVNIGGREYPYVQIGRQLWLAENLDYKWDGLGIGGSFSAYTVPHAWYYDNDEARYGENGNKYGLLYNSYAMRDLVNGNVANLPRGWRVPSKSDYDALITYIGTNSGKKLMSTFGWNNSGNGTDDFGFTGVACGAIITTGPPYSSQYVGQFGQLWTSDDYHTWYSGVFALAYNSINATTYVKGASNENGLAIRLVKDA